ncbi:hypothetical protein Tco_0726395 [Tanacetum coccineum]|uniref:HAT C-terminal dimerisation domain-containing protein n=1 Tax=Tanacetum coccineum TaxID=301880 RepID=A0ABQ4YFH1_9ASTR
MVEALICTQDWLCSSQRPLVIDSEANFLALEEVSLCLNSIIISWHVELSIGVVGVKEKKSDFVVAVFSLGFGECICLGDSVLGLYYGR